MNKSNKIEAEKSISWVFKLLQSPWACLIQQYRKRSRNCVRRTLSLKAQSFKNAYTINAEAGTFFKSISNNAQILLTFDAIEEEQLEAVNEDGTVNEEMVN